MIKRILVPLDGSWLAEKALPYAEELAQSLGAELRLVWVLHPLVIMSDYDARAYDRVVDAEQEEARSYLNSLQDKLAAHQVTTHSHVLEGPSPADVIVKLAKEENCDLIVMGTHGRSGLSRLIYGSVAGEVLQQAPCPVLLVRATEEA